MRNRSSGFELMPSFYEKVDANFGNSKLPAIVNDIATEGLSIMQEEVPVDTGALQEGITMVNSGVFNRQLVSAEEYWKYVNYGTFKMRANPFVVRTVDRVMASVIQAVMHRHLSGVWK